MEYFIRHAISSRISNSANFYAYRIVKFENILRKNQYQYILHLPLLYMIPIYANFQSILLCIYACMSATIDSQPLLFIARVQSNKNQLVQNRLCMCVCVDFVRTFTLLIDCPLCPFAIIIDIPMYIYYI